MVCRSIPGVAAFPPPAVAFYSSLFIQIILMTRFIMEPAYLESYCDMLLYLWKIQILLYATSYCSYLDFVASKNEIPTFSEGPPNNLQFF